MGVPTFSTTRHRIGETPSTAIAGWQPDRPLAAVLAGDHRGATRFSLLAEPTETLALQTLSQLESVLSSRRAEPSDFPFTSGWIGWIDYAAGRQIEPAAAHTAAIPNRPIAVLSRIEHGWIHDNQTGHWSTLGNPSGPMPCTHDHAAFSLGPPVGLDREAAFRHAVHQAVEFIHAGDVFQVNLTHRLGAPFSGSPRALMASLLARLAPWHGCYAEHGDLQVASASPELFLRVSPAGRVTTRPMKGTRPAGDASLAASSKDAAELAMIVDLMRNDLGRVCRLGSVRVEEARAIEQHGPARAAHVDQGVATISGQMRQDARLSDLIRACFPPGSITGAPKIRAMQIIDEIEPELGFDAMLPARGPYCGAIGYLGDDGSASLSVGIRTAIVQGDFCHYPVGAGIVADSEPEAEWQETLVKAGPFLDLCRGSQA